MKSTRAFCCLALAVACATSAAAFAQKPATVPSGPVLPAIIHAKSIFVSNAGSDAGLYQQHFSGDIQPAYLFSGDPDRPYSEFCAALEATGDYKLQNDPSRADLTLELQMQGPHSPLSPFPQFRLVVYGIQSPQVLWTITQAIEPAELQKNRDKNFDQALSAVLSRFLSIAGKGPVPTP